MATFNGHFNSSGISRPIYGTAGCFSPKISRKLHRSVECPHGPGPTFRAGYFELSYVEIWIWNVSEKWPPNMPKTAKIGRFPTSNGAVDNTTVQLIIISRYRVTDDPWPCNCIKDFFYRMIYILENAISKTHFFGFSAFLETFFWIFLIAILYLICFYRS